MHKWFLRAIIATLISSANISAYAMQCEVTYKAEKTTKVKVWLSTVDKKEYKDGKDYGVGDTLKACGENALAKWVKDGWTITSQDIKEKH